MKRICILMVTMGLAAMFVFPIAASAQFLVVDCSGANPYAYPTINSALPNAGPGAFIAVTGTCNESVVLYGVNNLTLGAFYGQTASLVGQLTVISSHLVYVYGLNITNPGGEGIYIQKSDVTLDTVSSSGNAGNGLQVTQSSDVTINAVGTFNNNQGYGIFNDANSFTHIVSWAGTTDISNNQNSAVSNGQASFLTFGNTHIANNGTTPNVGVRAAIDMRGGGKAQIGSLGSAFGFGPNVIENNPNGGVSLQENAEISFWAVQQPNAINIVRNNGPFGIEAGFGSQVTLAGASITGHTGPGVDIYAHSQLYGTSQIPGLTTTQIQNNATAGGSLNAAIRVDGNSEALLRGVTISQNSGPAILALVNSSVDFAGSTFSGNTGVISCDSTSSMVSDLAIAARTPAAGVSCVTAHSLGNRVVSGPAPAAPDISVWKKLHAAYQQRASAQK
jgi:hypothetical protein